MSIEDLLIETAGTQGTDLFRYIEVHTSQSDGREHFDVKSDVRGGTGFLADRHGKAGSRALAWQFSSEVCSFSMPSEEDLINKAPLMQI